MLKYQLRKRLNKLKNAVKNQTEWTELWEWISKFSMEIIYLVNYYW